MPPKEKKDDISNLVSQVKNIFPDFEINSELLRNPTTEFVTEFYSLLMANINEKIACFMDEEEVSMPESKEFNYKVHLFCQVSKLFCKLHLNTFCINDICRPVPRRTYMFIKTSIHFITYHEHNFDTIANLMREPLEALEKTNTLQTRKQELLEDLAQGAETLAKRQNEFSKLEHTQAEVTTVHKHMLDEKRIKDKAIADKQMAVDKLGNDCERLEQQLELAEVEETNLKQQVVSKEDFEGLKQFEQSLKTELECLSGHEDDLCTAVEAQKETILLLESCSNALTELEFGKLSQQFKEILELEDIKKKKASRVTSLSQNVETVKASVIELKAEYTSCSQRLELAEKDFGALQILMEEIKRLKGEIKTLTSEQELYDSSVKAEFDKITCHYNTTINNALRAIQEAKSQFLALQSKRSGL